MQGPCERTLAPLRFRDRPVTGNPPYGHAYRQRGKIVPVTLDCDVSLVDTPRAADGSREPTPTLLELGRVANNPPHDGGVRNHHGALRHHRGQISVAQLVRDVPAH